MIKKICKIGIIASIFSVITMTNISNAADYNFMNKHHKWDLQEIACGYNSSESHTVLKLRDLNNVIVDLNESNNKMMIAIYPRYKNQSGKKYIAVSNPKGNGHDMKKKGDSYNGNNGVISAKINSGMGTSETLNKYVDAIWKKIEDKLGEKPKFKVKVCGKSFIIKGSKTQFKNAMKHYFTNTSTLGGTLKNEGRIAGSFAARTDNSLKGKSINTSGIIKLTLEYEKIKTDPNCYEKEPDDVDTNTYKPRNNSSTSYVEGYVNPVVVRTDKDEEEIIIPTPDDRKVDLNLRDDTDPNRMDYEEICNQIEARRYSMNELKGLQDKINVSNINESYKYEIRATYVKYKVYDYDFSTECYTTNKYTTYPEVWCKTEKHTHTTGKGKKKKTITRWYVKYKDPARGDSDWHKNCTGNPLKHICYTTKANAEAAMESVGLYRSGLHPTTTTTGPVMSISQYNAGTVYNCIKNEETTILRQEINLTSSNPEYDKASTGGIGEISSVIKYWNTSNVSTTDDGYLDNKVKISNGKPSFAYDRNNCFYFTLTNNMGINTKDLATKYKNSNKVTVTTTTIDSNPTTKTYYLMRDLTFDNYKLNFGENSDTYDYNDTKLFSIYDTNTGGLKNFNYRIFKIRNDKAVSLGSYYDHTYDFGSGKVSGSSKDSEISMFFGVASNLQKDNNHLCLKDGSDWNIGFKATGNKFRGCKIENGQVKLIGNISINRNYNQPILDAEKAVWSSSSTITEIR